MSAHQAPDQLKERVSNCAVAAPVDASVPGLRAALTYARTQAGISGNLPAILEAAPVKDLSREDNPDKRTHTAGQPRGAASSKSARTTRSRASATAASCCQMPTKFLSEEGSVAAMHSHDVGRHHFPLTRIPCASKALRTCDSCRCRVAINCSRSRTPARACSCSGVGTSTTFDLENAIVSVSFSVSRSLGWLLSTQLVTNEYQD